MNITPVLSMIVGLPGSGKSYFVNHYFSEMDNINSSDGIREEFLKDVNNQEHNLQVFNILHERICSSLSKGISCVDDATNIEQKFRLSLLEKITEINCVKNVYVMMTSFEKCLSRNYSRDRKVPEYSIFKMAVKFKFPEYSEGWTNIYLVDEDLNISRVPEYF